MTEVDAIFGEHLRREGWTVQTKNSDHVDIRTTGGDEVLMAQVKGHAKSAGAALLVGYGQLPCRMKLALSRHCCTLVVLSSLERQRAGETQR